LRLEAPLTCYRIGDCDGLYPIYDDRGAALVAGRWHTPDQPVLYASEHYATAMLEKLAQANGLLPPNQHYIEMALPKGLSFEAIDYLDFDTQTFGANWAHEKRSCALFVPSFVARPERNILLNLRHPEAPQIVASEPKPVLWDERLFNALPPPRR
jgi:RES domain-containing protein